jgi:hypothetical protein
MELAPGFLRRQELESVPPANQGLAGWVAGALQGRIKIKWRGSAAARVEQHMELLETLSLGGKRQVMLIECEGERYLVGCGQDTVATIEKVSPESRRTVKTVAQSWL